MLCASLRGAFDRKKTLGPFPCFDYDLSACADRCTPIAVFGLFPEGQRSKSLIPGFQAAEASKFRLSKCLFFQGIHAPNACFGLKRRLAIGANKKAPTQRAPRFLAQKMNIDLQNVTECDK